MQKSLLITFEGIEASGKSTAIKLLEKKLDKEKYVFTFEPGGKGIQMNKDIRSIILNPKNHNMSYKTEALLFAAQRSQHIQEIIKPNLDKGINVICDRYMDSSLVYQGVCRGLGQEWIKSINDDLMPDITFFFDLTPKEMIERLKNRVEKSADRLDQEHIDMHKKAYNAYHELIKNDKSRFRTIDPNKTTEEIVDEIINVLNKY